MNNISVKNLKKAYQDFSLNNISFDIPEGKIVGFIGENGAGKTTTIKAILNLIKIDEGEIKLFGKDYKDKKVKEEIGVVLDDSFLPDELTPEEVSVIMEAIHPKWDDKKYFNYLKEFSLPLKKPMKDFSKGMLMKLKIATALSISPKLLILDEPTSGLDPVARTEILDIFQDFMEDETHSIFVSSHITSDLEHIADSIIFINNGEIVLNEECSELQKKYKIVKCTKEEFSKLKEEDYIAYHKLRNEIDVLIDNKTQFEKKYSIKNITNATIEDIMVLMIKGERK